MKLTYRPAAVVERRKANRMSSNHNAQSGWAVRCSALVRRFVRWKYVILTHKDYAARLNRSVEVEQALMDCAAGKRPALSKDECRQLAVKLGVPECFRSPNDKLTHRRVSEQTTETKSI